jgi:hypothetical protein
VKLTPPLKLTVDLPVLERISGIFSPALLRSTIIFFFLWFTMGFAYFGIVLITLILFESSDCGNASSSSSSSSESLCKPLTSKDYFDVLLTTGSELTSVVIANVLINKYLIIFTFSFILFFLTISIFIIIGLEGDLVLDFHVLLQELLHFF